MRWSGASTTSVSRCPNRPAGSSPALGSADVTLLALTNAYRAMANGGTMSPVVLGGSADKPITMHPVAAAKRVADPAAIHLVTDILSDNNARVRTFGMDNLLAARGFAAVKTGTSKNMRDNWCVGYTDRYTVGVWIGNTDGAAMREVSGMSGAAPIWRALVFYLHADRPSLPPRAPAGVVAAQVGFKQDREPPRRELFIAGTEQSTLLPNTQVRADSSNRVRDHGVATPRGGSIFALDPDIPAHAQRITFAGEAGIWLLDGNRIGDQAQPQAQLLWAPWPGRHRLVLKP